MSATILMSARPQDETAAEHLKHTLESFQLDVGLMPLNNAELIEPRLQAADALLIVITTNWQPDHPMVHHTLQAGLQRSDLLTIAVCIDGASIPPASALSADLQGLAYTPTIPFRTDHEDHSAVDGRRLAQQIHTHTVKPAQKTPGRVPWNLILIGTIFIAAFFMIIVQQFTRPDESRTDSESSPARVIIQPGENVVIGLAAGLSDRAAVRGQEMLNGVQLALEERGTIQIGDDLFPVDLLAQDTGCSSAGGQQVAELFTSARDVAGIIGHLCETSCRSATGIYDAADYVTISPACRAPGLTIDLSNSFNRTVPSQVNITEVTARFILNDLNIGQITIIHDEQIFSSQLADAFRQAFTARGGEVESTDAIESLTFTEASFVEALLAENPSAIYYAGRALNAAKIRAELTERGITDLPIILGDESTAEAYITITNSEPDTSNSTYILQTTPLSGDAVAALSERYVETYNTTPESSLFAYAYDATNMLLDSIEDAAIINENSELEIDRLALKGFVRSYFGEGVTGMLSCDGRGDCGTTQADKMRLENGVWVLFTPESES